MKYPKRLKHAGRSHRRTLRLEPLEPRVLLSTYGTFAGGAGGPVPLSSPFPVPLAPRLPAGALVYEGSVQADFGAEAETDDYTLTVDAGQRLTMVVEPAPGSSQAKVELYDTGDALQGSASASGVGEPVVLQMEPTATEGEYRIALTTLSGTGNYDLTVILNAAQEGEPLDGVGNDTTGSAEDIDDSAVDLQGGATRLAAGGELDSTDDFFSFDLTAGDYAALGLTVEGADDPFPLTSIDVADRPRSVALGDINGDGDLDIFAATFNDDDWPATGALVVIVNNGDGTYTADSPISLPGPPTHVAVGDVDGDSHLDVVLATYDDSDWPAVGGLAVFLGDGTGSLEPPAGMALSGRPLGLALGDLDGQHGDDIVLGFLEDTGEVEEGVLSVYLADGTGGFGAPQDTSPATGNAGPVALGDLNDDTHLDVVLSNGGDGGGANSVSVFLGQGDGSLGTEQEVGTGDIPADIALGDLDGDGVLDLATANQVDSGWDDTDSVSVLLGTGSGAFGAPTIYSLGGHAPRAVAIGDVNGDGSPDIVTADGYRVTESTWTNTLSLLEGNGTGTFEYWGAIESDSGPMDVALGDLTGNGQTEIVTANLGQDASSDYVETVSVLRGRPQVTLELLDPSGALIAVSTDARGGAMPQAIRGYAAAATGTYYARVSGGEAGQDYTLVVTREAEFELPRTEAEPFATQDITASGQVVGRLAGSSTQDVQFFDTETFESGTLDGDWAVWSSDAQGQIEVTGDEGTASGDYALLMDRDYDGMDRTLNEAIWTVDLSGQSGAFLSFWHAEFGESEDGFSGDFVDHYNADGIAISADGTNWHPVWEPEDQTDEQWEQFTVDIGAAAQSAGMALGSGFQIKFQQWDYRSAPSDGRAWDDLVLTTAGDGYTVAVEDGDSLTFTVTTPGDGSGEPANDLVPKLVVADETGTPVAQDNDLDGVLAMTAGSSGTYTVVVQPSSGSGDYALRVEGATGAAAGAFEVTATVPGDGELWPGFPATYVVDFSQPVDLTSLDPSDLTVDGSGATAVTAQSATRLAFDIAALDAGDAVYDVAIAAGALTSLSGVPLEAFAADFESEGTPPTVTDISPALDQGSVIAPGDLSFTITFSEELDTDGLDADDVTLTETVDGGSSSPDTFTYNAGAGTLDLTFLGLWEGAYTLTLASGADAFRDPAGNLLDGDADGTGGDPFVRSFYVDYTTQELSTPFELLDPVGGRIYRHPSTLYGVFHGVGDVDTFTVDLDAGQTATVNLSTEETAGVQAQLELLAPGGGSLGSVLTDGSGEAYLDFVELPTTGTYSITVTGVSGADHYYVGLTLNAEREVEPNDALGEAQALQADPSGDRYAVKGAISPGATDLYALALEAGDAVSLTADVYTTDRHLDLALLDGSGTVVAIGTEDIATNAEAFIRSFVAPATGTYYASVVGESSTTYMLVATVDHELALEPNQTNGEAQRLQVGWGAAGFLDDPGFGVEPDDYDHLTEIGTLVPGVTLTVVDEDAEVTAFTHEDASTGTNVFGHDLGTTWKSNSQTLRAEFDSPVDSVSIDVICSGARYGGFLVAYDADGRQLKTISTPQYAHGPQTLTIERTKTEIAAIQASGLSSYSVRLDNLVVGSDHEDVYAIQAGASETVTLSTTTPGDEAGVPLHDLDPRLEVFDAGGSPVAANDNGAFDGRNAVLSFQANGDPYFVRVSGSGRGDYELHVADTTLLDPAPTVTGTVPVADSVIAHAPAVIDITFSEALRADQLDPADLTVVGVGAATAVELADAFTARYTVGLDAADLEGPYSYTLAAGGVLDLQGTPSAEHTGEFFVDRTGPSVTTSSPLPTVGQPFSYIVVDFCEPIDPDSASVADIVSVTGPSGAVSISRVEVLDNTLTIVVYPLQVEEGTYTFELGPQITDYVGNPMDQDGDGTYGEPGDTYTGTFDLLMPDLVVDTVTLDPTAVQVGEVVDVTWLSRNASQMGTPSGWSVYFWLSTDTTLETGTDLFLYGTPAGAPVPMGHDQTHGDTTAVQIPIDPSISSGTNYLLVQVDALDDIDEGVESNNVGSAELEITESGLPDLVMSASADAAIAAIGETVGAHWTVTNAGAVPASEIWYDDVYLSLDETFDPGDDLFVGTYNAAAHSPLGAGEHYDVDMDLTVPTTVAPGNYYLLFIADRSDFQIEETTANNVDSVAFEVTAPDLTVEWLSVPSDAEFAETIEVTYRVHNEGNSAVNVVWSDWFLLSENAIIDGDEEFVGEADTTATIPLGPGEHHDETLSLTLPLEADLPTGTYHLIVRVDRENVVDESDEVNNTAAAEMALTVPPLPDLAVTDIEAPAEAWSGMQIPIEWEITNAGTLGVSGPWVDRISLADNPAGDNPISYKTVQYDVDLEPGEAVVRHDVITLPNDLAGTWWVVVSTDETDAVFEHANEANNTVPDDASMTVHLSEFPNLEVTEVIAPPTAFAGQTILVEWTVTNTGNEGTNADYWSDRVYLSDDLLVGVDHTLGTLTNGSYLAPGESYHSSLSVTLPRGADGPYYVLVKADVTDRVVEFGHEDDNVGASDPMAVDMPPVPDLQVTVVDAPPTAFSAQAVTIGWTVTNLGLGATDVAKWYDEIYLSENQTIDLGDVHLKGHIYHHGALDPGESYEATYTVTLPQDVSGSYYFLVRTDVPDSVGGSYVFEHVYEGNNTGFDDVPTEVFLTPPADLEVEVVDAPPAVLSGHEIEFTYRVANNGSLPTSVDSWDDAFYISTDDQFDIETDTFLGTVRHDGTLEVGEDYEATATATLPTAITGSYYLFVKTDSAGQIFELDAANNTLTDPTPMAVTTEPADLVIQNPSAPAEGEAGTPILVTWKVKNVGTGDTAVETWTDTVTLVGPGGGKLGSFEHFGLLDVNESYTESVLVTLPALLDPGAYSIIIETDVVSPGTETVYEGTDENNNTSVAVPITVTARPADLQITAEPDAPALANSGEIIQVAWTVRNFGTGPTRAEGWHDHVYLSTDTSLDAETDVLLESFQRANALAASAEYDVTLDAEIPIDLSGNFYVIVWTDAGEEDGAAVPESDEMNNTWAVAAPLTVLLSPTPDLVVQEVDAPATAYTGRAFDVTWTIRNDGADATDHWSDKLYLSRDLVLDTGTDAYLGSERHEAGLGEGLTYQKTKTVAVPADYSGNLYVFVVTDATARIHERDAEDNNTGLDSSPMDTSIAPPADLRVTSIVVPPSGTPGDEATIEYTVINDHATNPAEGLWYDSLYLSADATWDIDDPLIDTAAVYRTIAAGATYTESVTAELPAAAPGDYFVIVRTDIRNNIRETDEANNARTSDDAITLDAQALALDTPFAGTIADGQSIHFYVDVPAGEALYVVFDSDSDTASNELYLRYTDAATRTQHDVAYSAPFSPDQEVIVPETAEGRYYILAYGDAEASNYTIEAQLLDFAITDESYGEGGNAGNLTLAVHGAKFDRSVTAWLTDESGFRLPAESLTYVSTTKLYATFDLSRLEPGLYDLAAASGTRGEEALVPDALEVVSSTQEAPLPWLNTAPWVWAGRHYSFEVSWANFGSNDVVAPLLVLHSELEWGEGSGEVYFSPNPDGPHHRTNLVFYGAGSDDGPAGILRPDQAETMIMYGYGTPLNSVHILHVTNIIKDPSLPFDWDATYDDLRENVVFAGVTTEAFDAAFAWMQDQVGTTWGDYHEMLSRNSTLTPWVNGEPRWAEGLAQLEFTKALAATGTGITGRGFAYDMGVDLSGRLVTALNTDTDEIFFTDSLNDGTFYFHSLTAGTYELTFDSAVVLSGSTVEVGEGEAVSGVELELSRGSRVGGTALDAVSGSAVAGAAVTLRYDDGTLVETETDENGFYEFTALAAGTCALTFESPATAPYETNDIVLGETDYVTQNVDLPLTGRIQGFVDLQAGGPEGYEVHITAHRAGGGDYEVLVDGLNFAVSEIPGGTYSMTFFRYGYVVGELNGLAVTEGDILDVGAVHLDRAARIEGTVDIQVPGMEIRYWNGYVAAYDGDAIAGVGVVGATGSYLIDYLAPGTYDVRVVETSYGVSTEQEVTVYAGAEMTGVDLALLPGGVIAGTVTNTATGQPAEGVTVQAAKPSAYPATTTTDENGEYRFEWLGLGTYAVGLTTGGADGSGTVDVVATDGTELTLDLAYSPVATLGGYLWTSGGLIVPDGVVALYENGMQVASAHADDEGAFEFALFTAGTFELRASSGYVVFPELTGIDVAAGDAVVVDLVSGTGVLEVVVDDPGGLAEGTMTMRFERTASDRGAAGTVDLEDGQVLTFGNLSAGDYLVEVRTLDGRGGTGLATVADGQTTPLTVTIGEQHTVYGQITDALGDPLADAWLFLTSTADPDAELIGISDSGGYYEIGHVDAGTYDLVVLLDGYDAAIQPGLVVAGDAEADVALAVSTTELTGRIVAADGTPVPKADVAVVDADGHVVGQVLAGADGVFRVTTASGDDLTLRVGAEGFGLLEVQDVDVAAGTAVDVADQALAAVALGQAPTFGEAPAPPLAPGPLPAGGGSGNNGTDTNTPPLFPLPPATPPTQPDDGGDPGDGGGGEDPPLFPLPERCLPPGYQPPDSPLPDSLDGYPTYLDQILETIGDEEQSEDEVTYSDLGSYPTECSGKCGYAYNRVLTAINSQNQKWDLVETYDEIVDNYVNIAMGLFVSELACTFATVSAAIITGYSVAAALGWGAAATALEGVGTGVTVAGHVGNIVNALYTGGMYIYDSLFADGPATSKSMLEHVETQVGVDSTILTSLDSITGLIDIARAADSTPAYGRGALLGCLGLIAGWRSILAHMTVQDTVDTLNQLDSEYNTWKFNKGRYKASVENANTLLTAYEQCLTDCDDDDDDDDNGGDGDDTDKFSPIVPKDPNDIVGPAGVGEERWVAATAALPYMIRFENDAEEATAPAHVVRITQQLDDDLDFRTFRVGDIGFGDTVIHVPDDAPFFMTRLDLIEEAGIYLDIAAGINVLTGQATWVFTSLDPETGDVPDDPMLGFLPPNIESPEGQGWVTYTVRPSDDAETGEIVDAQASIVFDTNDPIDTPPVFNTIDGAAPTSQVDALPGASAEEEILVTWSGTDDANGSAIDSYTVYVSDSGAAFVPWLSHSTATQAPFVGQTGHTYTFYSVADDAAGNREAAPAGGDTTTLIGDDPDAPTASLVVPLDGGPDDQDPDPNEVATTTPLTTLEIQLADVGSGIDDASVDAADLALVHDGTPLNEGTDYSFYYNTLNDLVILSPIGGGDFDDGSYTLTVTDGAITDLAGNPLAETTFVVDGDATPPDAPHSLAIDPDTGASTADGITSTGTVELSGSLAEAGLAVHLYDVTSATDLGDATVDGTGFTADLALDPGEHQLRAISEDALGNTSDPVFLDVVVDTAAPTSSVDPLSALSGVQFTVAWTGDDAETAVASYDIFVATDGGATTLWLDDTAEGSATFDAERGHTYAFYSRATDTAGNEEDAPGVADTTTRVNARPQVGSVAPDPDPVVRGTALTLTASNVTDADGNVEAVEFYRDVNGNGTLEIGTDTRLGTDATSADGWSWTGAAAWAAGPHTYLARAQDDDGGWGDVTTTTGDVINVPPEGALIGRIDADGGFVYVYDTDAATPGDADVTLAEVAVKSSKKGIKTVVLNVEHAGLGIAIVQAPASTTAVSVTDATKTPHTVSYIVADCDLATVKLKGDLVGHDLNGLTFAEGHFAFPADIDADGTPDDPLGLWTPGNAKKVDILGDVTASLVVGGDLASFLGRNGVDTDVLVSGFNKKHRVMGDWSGTWTAAGMGSGRADGDAEADLTLTAAGLEPDDYVLGKMKVGGHIACTWDIAGNVKEIKAASIEDTFVLDADGFVKTLYATDGLDGTATALWFKTVKTKGELGIDLTATGQDAKDVSVGTLQALLAAGATVSAPRGVKTVKLANWTDSTLDAAWLGSASVKGWLDNVVVTCSERIGKATFGAVAGSTLFAGVNAGVTDLPDAAADFDAGAQGEIGKLTVKGIKNEPEAVIDSLFAAWTITKLQLRDVRADNAGVPFGIAAVEFESIKWRQGRDKYAWPADWPDATVTLDFLCQEVV